MAIQPVSVQRFSVTSTKSFLDVVAALHARVGHPDMAEFGKSIASTKSFSDLEECVRVATGPTELMEFTRFDLGAVLRKKLGASAPQSLRLVVGNPVIMSQMVQHAPDAGSYAPVTILIDERKDGVHLSYDRMESYLAPYGKSDASKVARDLDSKVEALLIASAND